MRNLAIAPIMFPGAESAGRRPSSKFHAESPRLTSDPIRQVPGPIAQISPTPCIPGAPPYNVAPKRRMCSGVESGDRPDLSRFPQSPARSPGDPGRLILGPFYTK